MGTDFGPGSELVVCFDHSEIHQGRLDDLKAGIRRLVAFVESHEPQLVSYGFHLHEELGRLTVVAVHPDSESLEMHLEVGVPEFRKLADMITLRRIEVYGSIGYRARVLLEQKALLLGPAGVTVHERFSGFARPATVGSI